MISWRDTAFAFATLPDIGALLLSATPAWIWSRDGSRVLWANPAGGKVLGAASFPSLWEKRWPESHHLRRSIASLTRALPDEGTLARLRLTDDLPALPVGCRCSPIRSTAERGVLIVALEGAGRPPSLAALASFFSGPRADAAILDTTGEMLAESAPETAYIVRLSTPHVEFFGAGRKLSLYVLERRAAPDEDEPETAPPAPVFDNAGLAMPPARPPREVHVQKPARAASGRESTAADASVARKAEPPASTPTKPATVRPLARQPAPPPKRETNGDAFPLEQPLQRSVMAGRVAQDLSRKPVRFLWQTDAADRYLFVSPGLAQVVGRNAEVVGERWQDVSARLRLDPSARIARALRQRDTWSGLTAWWPIEGSNVRVPVELTALPVFGADQSFQGYRGFGILRPAEALMPATFESRFAADAPLAEQVPPYEESAATVPANVVPIRSDIERIADHALTPQERNAFEEIAAALRDRVAAGLTEPAPVIDAPDAVIDGFEISEEREPAPIVTPATPPQEPARVAAESPAPSTSEPSETPPPKAAGAPREIFVGRASSPRAALARDKQVADAQQRLREMTAILDTATDGVIILDARGRIESANASSEALFGLEAQEMVGRDFAELLTPASRKSALDYLSGLRDSGVASLLNEGREVEAVAGSGSIPLFMTMGRISSEEEGRFCAVLRDITHWKRIESELLAAKLAAEQASQQKSDFLARVSHEIRTPLNAIIGFAEVMIEERFGAVAHERYREYLRDIRTSGEHVVSLVNDLLDISKIEAGKLDVQFTAVMLNELVRESINLMQPQANRARVVVRSSLSREVPAIVADERTLRQIILNLLSNSVKFTGPGGQVIASTSLSESGEAILRIRDTGEGMSEEELARALEPFRQLSTATIADRSGTGLGLPLTKALVEANRATLTIKSARGEGTVVTVTIPATRVLSE